MCVYFHFITVFTSILVSYSQHFTSLCYTNILNFHVYILTFSHWLSDCLVACLFQVRNFVYSACILATVCTYPHSSHCYTCFVGIPPILTNLTVTFLLLCHTKQSTLHIFLRICLPQSFALAIAFIVCCCIHLFTYLTCSACSSVRIGFSLLLLYLHSVITLRLHTKLNILTFNPSH